METVYMCVCVSVIVCVCVKMTRGFACPEVNATKMYGDGTLDQVCPYPVPMLSGCSSEEGNLAQVNVPIQPICG